MRWVIMIMILSSSAMQPAGAGIQNSHPIFPDLSDISAFFNELMQPAKSDVRPSAATSRGHLLYENHCQVCHTSNVHQRKNHRANTPADIRRRITTTCSASELKWKAGEIDDVVDYVTDTYYKF